MRRRLITIGAKAAMALAALVLCAIAVRALSPKGDQSSPTLSPIAPTDVTSTSRDGLAATVAAMSARLAVSPTDSDAAVRLADAWLRQARVLNHGGLPKRAEAVLDRVIEANPSDYLARRQRAAVYLAQHRFTDAILEAGRCRALRPDDAWIDGVLGDAHLELGHQAEAVAAFDRMMARRPDAAAYARASYARELQGDVRGAIDLMQMAASATSAHDPESQAWHAAQLGHLLLLLGDPASARREYLRADALFPGHPFSVTGLAAVDLAEHRPADALARLTPQLATSPSADNHALAGDAWAQLGRADEAERHYRLAEAMWTSDTPDPKALDTFLTTRGRSKTLLPAGARQ